MHDKLLKMMAKKKDAKPMSDMEKKAKLDSVNELRQAAQEAMGGKLDGLKTVKVASDSTEGLKRGLDTAREVMSGPEHDDMVEQAESDKGVPFNKEHDELSGHMNEDESSEEESPEHEASESSEEEASEHPEMSHEELDAELERLMALKNKMGSKKA